MAAEQIHFFLLILGSNGNAGLLTVLMISPLYRAEIGRDTYI